jgi:hypothetical protein
LLNFPPSTAKTLFEAIKAATLVFDGASVQDSNVYRKCLAIMVYPQKILNLMRVYIYGTPPKDPPFLTYLYIVN